MGSKKANRATRTNKIETIIGQGIVIDGIVNGDASIRIDGTVKGNITINGLIIVGETGVLEGTVSTQNLLVAGHAEGNITVSECVEVVPGGHLLGDITTKTLVMGEGALFDGSCHMTQHKTNAEPQTAETIAEPAAAADPAAVDFDDGPDAANIVFA